MHPDHEFFVTAIQRREVVEVAFTNDENRHAVFVRTCAPIDYGPSEPARFAPHWYHFWDFGVDLPAGPATLSLPPALIVSIQGVHDTFDPGEFVTWATAWHYPRDWGAYS
jgi:hypothetical protein